MATVAEADLHRTQLDELVSLAHRDLVDFWSTLRGVDADTATAAVRVVMPEIVTAYGDAAAELAATFYEDLRDSAGVAGAFTADLADLPDAAQIDAVAGWATSPLRLDVPDDAKALSLLAGGLQRLVAGMDRDTIAGNVRRDKAKATFARHASANCCAFCAMLATRGAVYASEKTALHSLKGKYHNDCHCVAVPEWHGATFEAAPYVSGFDTAYADAVRSAGSTDTSAVLAQMRLSLGKS